MNVGVSLVFTEEPWRDLYEIENSAAKEYLAEKILKSVSTVTYLVNKTKDLL